MTGIAVCQAPLRAPQIVKPGKWALGRATDEGDGEGKGEGEGEGKIKAN